MNRISASPDLIDVSNCPVCGSSSNSQFENYEDNGKRITYRLCSNCGTVFQSPRMTEASLRSYYEAEYVTQHQHATGVTDKELRIQAGRARNLARMLSVHVRSVQRHLDIGSSTGSLMRLINDEYGSETVGIEPAEVYRAYCAARGLEVVPDLESLGNGSYDLITMAHVVEHLPDPVSYLKSIREQWLTDNGTLLVEVPNLYGHLSFEVPHLFCFSAETLRYTLAQSGFAVISMESHGSPRSRLIPLYLTAIAVPVDDLRIGKSSSRTVRIKRRWGMAWNRFASRIVPGWAWLPLPDLEGEQG